MGEIMNRKYIKLRNSVVKISISALVLSTIFMFDNNIFALENKGFDEYKSNFNIENEDKKIGWVQNIDKNWYWVNEDGTLAKDQWLKIEGTWYRFDRNGKMLSNSWFQDTDKTWYWLKSSGAMASNQWLKINGIWYRFSGSGSMLSNKWYQDSDKKWYWLKSSGAMASEEILKIKEIFYKFNLSGVMTEEDIINIGKVISDSPLNIRSGPGTSYSKITDVSINNYLQILDTSNSGWYKVKLANDKVGWASSKYISLENKSSGNKNELVQKVIDVAYQQLGKPYEWGSNGPSSFDCSGLTSYSYKQGAGITLPRVSRDQAKIGIQVSKNELEEGDLVFFSSTGTTITHVGMYVGDSKFIHSPRTGDVVKISRLDSSTYSKNYVTARRVIN